MHQLVTSILEGNRDKAIRAVRSLVDRGVKHNDIVINGIEAAMKQLDLKCTAEQFNLLEIMLSGRAVMAVLDELFPPGAPSRKSKGTVVLCSIEGDVHDLGKNIVKIIFMAVGYRVVDCGKDCPLDLLVKTAKDEHACAVGISGLITIVINKVRQVKKLLIDSGMPDIKVLAGGAALKQASPQDLYVDYVAENVFDGLHYLERIRNAE
jgi:methylmalonyl-CoA mutase cobalamin-binding domain/chain